MRVVVIGGSGHVGTYLIPALVGQGHEVVNVSRGASQPYRPHAAWARVTPVTADREAEERDGAFAARIADLEPDAVVDMIAFTLESAQGLAEALRGRVSHLIHIGTIWVHGPLREVPATEEDPLSPFGEYGTQKAAIETWLLREAARTGLPATVVRPGHIVGPGWTPLNPAGHFNAEVFARIARGEELALPNLGLETVHHVHAEDVAQVVWRALARRPEAVGEAFNAVSPRAVTLRGYAEALFALHGHEPRLRFLPFEEWAKAERPEDAAATWEHIARSPSHSCEKARRRLGYQPRWGSVEAVWEAVGSSNPRTAP